MTDKPQSAKTPYRKFKDYQKPPYDHSYQAAFERVVEEFSEELSREIMKNQAQRIGRGV
jgi:hypothetical protein